MNRYMLIVLCLALAVTLAHVMGCTPKGAEISPNAVTTARERPATPAQDAVPATGEEQATPATGEEQAVPAAGEDQTAPAAGEEPAQPATKADEKPSAEAGGE